MPSKAQAAAEQRYEESGKRPGKKITIRLSDKQHAQALTAADKRGMSLAGWIKSRLGLTE
jgi:predicted HicB family RNase H-like nuclease